MTKYDIDNSDRGDIDRTILWQYDNATHLIGVINIFKDFFEQAVKNFWDGFAKKVNLSDENEVDDYGLAVWGKILNVSRTIATDGDPITLSSDLYRKILAARFKLATENASLESYSNYVDAIFDGKVRLVDEGTMSLYVAVNDGAETLTEEEQVLVDNPQVWMIYPAGVKSADHSTSLILGLSDDNDDPQDIFCGGLDESSFYWGYVPTIEEGDSQ